MLIPAFTGANLPIADDDDSDEGYERQSVEGESREELAALRKNSVLVPQDQARGPLLVRSARRSRYQVPRSCGR